MGYNFFLLHNVSSLGTQDCPPAATLDFVAIEEVQTVVQNNIVILKN